MNQQVDFQADERLIGLAEPGAMGDRLKFGEPLSKHCSLRIGGPAAVWAEVATLEELRAVVEAVTEKGAPVHVVGLGSNLLFPDEGIDGAVIRLVGELAEFDLERDDGEEGIVSIGAGAVNAHIVRGLHAQGWVGAEFLALVPGTFGGAVVMNAGTKHGELAEVLVDAEVLEADGSLRRMTPAELGFRYRHSDLEDDSMVVAGRIRVRQGDVDEARAMVKEDRDHRNETQPYRYASVGSTFANPDGDWAGRLIDEVGLKGRAQGDARISDLHANFFINDGEATAEDFLTLMALARAKVREQFGIELRPEVQFVGFDGWTRLLEYERKWEEQGCF
ncbi:MAG: UDP-N-acetylmuramate dehydrogenase [Myxococcota bacterium]